VGGVGLLDVGVTGLAEPQRGTGPGPRSVVGSTGTQTAVLGPAVQGAHRGGQLSQTGLGDALQVRARPRRQFSTSAAVSHPSPCRTSIGVTNPLLARAASAALATRCSMATTAPQRRDCPRALLGRPDLHRVGARACQIAGDAVGAAVATGVGVGCRPCSRRGSAMVVAQEGPFGTRRERYEPSCSLALSSSSRAPVTLLSPRVVASRSARALMNGRTKNGAFFRRDAASGSQSMGGVSRGNPAWLHGRTSCPPRPLRSVGYRPR
jgi:hypothetical protein